MTSVKRCRNVLEGKMQRGTWASRSTILSLILVGMIVVDAEAEMKVIKRKVTIEDVHEWFREGMTRKEVEAVFSSKGISYNFIPRDNLGPTKMPGFKLSSPNAEGLYATIIQNNGRTWWLFIVEDLRILIEINAEEKVS